MKTKKFIKGMVYRLDDNTQYIILDSQKNGRIITYQKITRSNRFDYTLSNPVITFTLTCFERLIFLDKDIDRIVSCENICGEAIILNGGN